MKPEAVEISTVWRCLECEAVSEPAEGSLYECSRCGSTFTQETSADGGSNRCAQCNIFGAKIADDACPECNEAEVEEVRAFQIDGEWVVLDDADDGDEEAQIDRALAARAEREREREEREKLRQTEEDKARERYENAVPTRVDTLAVGDIVLFDYGEQANPGPLSRRYVAFRISYIGDHLAEAFGAEQDESEIRFEVEEWDRWLDEWRASPLRFVAKPDEFVRAEVTRT